MPSAREPRVSFGCREVPPDVKKRLVHDLFGPLAARYDLADTVLSAGLDARWRRKAVRLMGLGPGRRVLDVCGGTAGLALLAARDVSPGGRVFVYDFNLAMMAVGRKRARRLAPPESIAFIRGDAEDLGVSPGSFDAAMIGFGLRNLARPERGLAGIRRALKPGGTLMILEFSLPAHALVRRLYHFYSFRAMPLLAGLLGGSPASFRYLAESIRLFPGPEDVRTMIREAGFADVRYRRLADGIVVVYTGRKFETEDS